MDTIAGLGTNIGEIVGPTMQAYFKLQRPRKTEIFKNPPTEHSYGPHPRQKLDVYLPQSAEASSTKLPCIVFLYGGGLVRGDKRMPPTDGTIYANAGKYFSDKGFVTVLPDYRLVGQHDAVYPSGGVDVALALHWVVKNLPQVDENAIFLVGNSAGGVHSSTYLWSNDIPDDVPRTRCRALVLISVPMSFEDADEYRLKDLNAYYKDDTTRNCPKGLRKTSSDKTETLIMLAEKDPEVEILKPNRDFLELCSKEGLEIPEQLPMIKGHNHISPLLALGLGGEEDAWGDDLVSALRKRCNA